MALKVPYSLPPQKQPERGKINQDEYERILSIVNDNDLGVEGGEIEETAQLEAAKDLARENEKVSGDKEDTLFDQARKRALEGNNNFAARVYVLKKGEDLRKAALNVYGDANGWIILAAANDIINPSSDKEVYETRELIII